MSNTATEPLGFFVQALEAAEGLADVDLDSIGPVEQTRVRERIALVTRALREAVALNTGILAESEGLRRKVSELLAPQPQRGDRAQGNDL